MSILIESTMKWSPAADVMFEDEIENELWEKDEKEHLAAPLKEPRYLYSFKANYFSIQPKQMTKKQWKQEQYHRLLTPIGTRTLLRRRIIPCETDDIVYDIMMERVDEPHRWECYHVFYEKRETSPLPFVHDE